MTWDDYQALGQALSETYPDANYMAISNDELRALVLSLPGFDQTGPAPDQVGLSAIRLAWVAAAEGPEDTYDPMA